jgi:hypothetical protein
MVVAMDHGFVAYNRMILSVRGTSYLFDLSDSHTTLREGEPTRPTTHPKPVRRSNENHENILALYHQQSRDSSEPALFFEELGRVTLRAASITQSFSIRFRYTFSKT